LASVPLPTKPSASKPFAACHFFTASAVPFPKIPSAPTPTTSCTSFTSYPLEPIFSSIFIFYF